MPVSKTPLCFIYFRNALSGLKFTRQNAEICSSGYLSKQSFPGVHAIFHYLGSPLSYRTLIFDLMRNLNIYNACIFIYSI